MIVVRRPSRSPWNLEREVDSIFQRAFGFEWPSASASGAAFEVIPDAEGVTVRAELPGVDPANIGINVEGRVLTISATRPGEQRQHGAYALRERAYGQFARSLRLSEDLDAEAVSAEAKHGVLTVRIPKRAEAKPRQIEVKVG